MKQLAFALALVVSARALAEPPVKLIPPPELPPLSPLQSPEASLSPLHLGDVDLLRVEHRARIKRNVGIGLALPGVALVVLGAVLVGVGIPTTPLVTSGKEIAAGAIGSGAGILLTIPGAILWVRGQDDLDVAAWRRRRMEDDSTH